jgi:translation initiation factor 2B subunit (eIF-2B alpha/beta/delta family)
MTTNQPQNEPTLTDVIEQIQELKTELREGLETNRKELRAEVERWDERFFQFSRDNLNTSRTIIITAGSVVVLSPVLQALAPAIKTIVARLTEGDMPQ